MNRELHRSVFPFSESIIRFVNDSLRKLPRPGHFEVRTGPDAIPCTRTRNVLLASGLPPYRSVFCFPSRISPTSYGLEMVSGTDYASLFLTSQILQRLQHVRWAALSVAGLNCRFPRPFLAGARRSVQHKHQVTGEPPHRTWA